MGLSIYEILSEIDLPLNGNEWQKIRKTGIDDKSLKLINKKFGEKDGEKFINLIKIMTKVDSFSRPDIAMILKDEKNFFELNKRYLLFDKNEFILSYTLKHNGKCLTTVQVTEVWAGNLSDGTYALLLLNRGSIASKVQISWKELGLKTSKVKLRDLWERKDLGEYKEKYTAYLASHDSLLFKVFPLDDKEEPEEEVFKVENIVMIVLGAIILIGICAFVYTYLVNRKKQKKDEESKEDKLIDKKE